MKKNRQQKNKEFLLGVILFVAILGVVLLVKFFYIPTATYHSQFLKITFSYPEKFQLEERFGTIVLKNRVDEEIVITRTGTNYNSLEEYLKASDLKNKGLYSGERKNISINGLKGVESTIAYSKNLSLNHKGYSFLIHYGIYSLYTTVPSLYPDLDRIARSFHYEP